LHQIYPVAQRADQPLVWRCWWACRATLGQIRDGGKLVYSIGARRNRIRRNT
jgi:hypothetical protein